MAVATREVPGALVLQDGAVFTGRLYLAPEREGPLGVAGGEVVFNTSMVGYQEILTDPSYAGQIVTLTYPLIGNYGASHEHTEARSPFARGLVVHELCPFPSHWSQEETLQEFMGRHGLPILAGVDTRALVRHLRRFGTLLGVMGPASDEAEIERLRELARQVPPISGQDLVRPTTTPSPYVVGPEDGSPQVVLVDLGSKTSILKEMTGRGVRVHVVPAWTSAREILALNPDGVLLSNGPGDPQDIPYVVEIVHGLLGKVPLYGICLGHQVLGLALGGRTYKMKFGHRGGNHPVKELATGRVYITSQNHGYAVERDSLRDEVEVTYLNLNDGTVEGMSHPGLRVESVQFHPEASPGPLDTAHLFDRFIQLMRGEG